VLNEKIGIEGREGDFYRERERKEGKNRRKKNKGRGKEGED
jgi:hypothetical protein